MQTVVSGKFSSDVAERARQLSTRTGQLGIQVAGAVMDAGSSKRKEPRLSPWPSLLA